MRVAGSLKDELNRLSPDDGLYSGTLVFGNGIPALVGRIRVVGPDAIVFNGHPSDTTEGLWEYVVPLSSIAYFRRDA